VGAVDEGEEMLDRAMHAAVGHEAEEMQATASLLRFENDVPDDEVLGQRPVVHREVDPRDVHHGDASGAEVQVPDLAVAHLPGRQPDVRAARSDDAVRVAGLERVERRRLREAHRVVAPVGALTESVQDHQDERAGWRRAGRTHAARR
jgi:hypothetical protein